LVLLLVLFFGVILESAVGSKKIKNASLKLSSIVGKKKTYVKEYIVYNKPEEKDEQ